MAAMAARARQSEPRGWGLGAIMFDIPDVGRDVLEVLETARRVALTFTKPRLLSRWLETVDPSAGRFPGTDAPVHADARTGFEKVVASVV